MEILITEQQIHERIHELGKQIEADYQGRPLTIVAILTGSLIVLADLIREIQVPLRVALLQASSYKGATTRAGWRGGRSFGCRPIWATAAVKLGGRPFGELRPALAWRDDLRENGGALDGVRVLPAKGKNFLVPRLHP